jgi:hypothetical protein
MYVKIPDITLGAEISRWYSAGLRAGGLGVRIPVGTGNFSPHHFAQTGSGAHLASYPTATPGGKVAGA